MTSSANKVFNQKLGESIKLRRNAIGISQADLAEATGISRTSIANIEVGRQGISAFQEDQFSKILADPMTALKARKSKLLAQLAKVQAEIDAVAMTAPTALARNIGETE